jgi:hypothetical protein
MYDAGLICFGMIKIILPAGFAMEIAKIKGRAVLARPVCFDH